MRDALNTLTRKRLLSLAKYLDLDVLVMSPLVSAIMGTSPFSRRSKCEIVAAYLVSADINETFNANLNAWIRRNIA